MNDDRSRRDWLALTALATLGSGMSHDARATTSPAGEIALPGQLGPGGPDATDALRQLFDKCIGTGMTAVLSGYYLVSGRLTSSGVLAAGQLHIRCMGDVRIRVAPDAAPFDVLIACHSSAPNDASLVGGRLTIDLSGRCASGLVLRHDGPEGGCVFLGPLTVRDARNLNPADVNENQGVLVHGRYQHIDLVSTRVSGVDRSNPRGGACKGISISGAAGQVTLHQPMVELVKCTGSAADADGISVFGQLPAAGAYAWRMADVQILRPVVRDCQGRSLKIQASEALVDRPRIYRQFVQAFAGPDIDFQVGNGLLRDPFFDYRAGPTGAGSLNEGFYPISLQQQSTDQPMLARVVGGILRAASPLPRLAFITVGAQAQDGLAEIDGLRGFATRPAAPGLFTRAVVEISGDQISRSTARTAVRINDLRGQFGRVPMLGYTEASERAGVKLDVEITNNRCDDADAIPLMTVGPIAGRAMPRWRRVALSGNLGWQDVITHALIDIETLATGTTMQVDLASCRLNGAPPDLPKSGIAEVQVASAGPGRKSRPVRIDVVSGGGSYRAWRDEQAQWASARQ